MPYQQLNSHTTIPTDGASFSGCVTGTQERIYPDAMTTVDLLVTVDTEGIATIVSSDIDGLVSGESRPILDLITLDYTSRMRRLLGKCRRTGQTQRDAFELRGFADRHLMFVARPSGHDDVSHPASSIRQIIISGCDISDLVIRHREVERQAVLLEQVLEVAPNNIFWKDKECRFIGGNRNFLNTLGVDSIEDVVEKTDFDFSPFVEAQSYQTTDANVMQCGQPVLNLVERRTRDDGTETVLRTNKVPMRNKEGEITGLLGVFEEITEQKQIEDKLRHHATHDDLTGLFNRRMLLGEIGQLLDAAMAKKSGAEVSSLLYIDIDRFKLVNDSLGHVVGDQLLIAIAQRLQSVVGAEQFLARLGGDEFAILLTTATEEGALTASREVVAEMTRAFHIDEMEIYSTASVGVVKLSDRYTSPIEVLRDADIAMYRAKSAGKSRFQLFDQSMYIAAAHELTRQNEIRRAVEAMEFELYFQPVINLGGQTCTGFEALIRWTPPGKQPVSPAVFVPYLEETGSIIPVGEWVIGEACRQLRVWQDRHPDMQSPTMAINLSSIQFNSARLVPTIIAALERQKIAPSQLVLEITETAVFESPRLTITKLKELRSMGIRVAMDDFGIGYSALGRLDQLPIDTLKIDRSFVERIGYGDGEPLVKAVLQMAQTLGMTTIAEGIEHYDQADWLLENGCTEAQGYLYSRPLPAQTNLHPFEHINLPGYA